MISHQLCVSQRRTPHISKVAILSLPKILNTLLMLKQNDVLMLYTYKNVADLLSIEELLLSLTAILDDESSVATRLSLIALKNCISSVLDSVHSELGLKALLALLQVKFHPYWLVKVSSCILALFNN